MWAWLLSIAGGLAVLAGGLTGARKLSEPMRHVWLRFKAFLEDWNGNAGRPGTPRVPSFPERMTAQEKATGELASYVHDLAHFARSDLAARLQLMHMMLETQQARDAEHAVALEELRTELAKVNSRVTDHRRRNDEQIDVLQRAVNDLARDFARVLPGPDQEE